MVLVGEGEGITWLLKGEAYYRTEHRRKEAIHDLRDSAPMRDKDSARGGGRGGETEEENYDVNKG